MRTKYFGPVCRKNLTDHLGVLEQVAHLLREGHLIAIPTETVYGLAASALDEKGLGRVYTVKGRDRSVALSVQISDLQQLELIAREVPLEFEKLASHFLPGPLTIVLKKNRSISDLITAGRDTVAVRLSSDKIAKKIVELVGCPIALSSANLSGRPSPTCVEHLLEDLGGKISGVVDGGETLFRLESTLISLEDPKSPSLLRFGVIDKGAIEEVLSCTLKVDPKALKRPSSHSLLGS